MEHTELNNLFSCLWFKEVHLFTPRDQLSFGYVAYRLRGQFKFHMFPNCEYNSLFVLHPHTREHSSKVEWVKSVNEFKNNIGLRESRGGGLGLSTPYPANLDTVEPGSSTSSKTSLILSSSMDSRLGEQSRLKVVGRAKSKEAYDLVIETAKVLSIQVEALNGSSSARVNLEELAKQPDVEESINAGNVPHVMLLDPNLSQTKGRKRDGKGKEVVASGRLKSGLELSTNKRKRKCNCCGKRMRHDKRNCPENPIAKKKYNETCSDGMYYLYF
ncbi:hypothetical protein Dimus_026161 [Dionaea muscipula]